MLKRIYQACAWLAVANLFAVGGLVAYLFISGKLNADRVNQIAVVLRGEFPKSQVQASQPTLQEEKPQSSRDELARLEARKRYYELISDRHRRDLEDRNSLGQSIQLDVNRQLDQIQTKEQEFTKQKEQIRKASANSGFTQTMEIFSDMDPKLAKDTMRNGKDADAVQLLMQMDANRRKKIINACKTAEEKAWIGRLLIQMRGLDATSAATANSAGKTGTADAAEPALPPQANTGTSQTNAGTMNPTPVSGAAGASPTAR
jgi:hypothetical protein